MRLHQFAQNRGTFASTQRQSACTACLGQLSTETIGSMAADACSCPEGTFRDKRDRLTCRACPSGMHCGFGSDEACFDRGGGTDAHAVCSAPLAMPGFMTLPAAPLHVFRCASEEACPGGRPSSCGELRDPAAVACGRCAAEAHMSRDGCSACRKYTRPGIFKMPPGAFEGSRVPLKAPGSL